MLLLLDPFCILTGVDLLLGSVLAAATILYKDCRGKGALCTCYQKRTMRSGVLHSAALSFHCSVLVAISSTLLCALTSTVHAWLLCAAYDGHMHSLGGEQQCMVHAVKT